MAEKGSAKPEARQVSMIQPRSGAEMATPTSVKPRMMVVPVPRYSRGKVSVPSDTTDGNSNAWPKPQVRAGMISCHCEVT